jgi:integrase
MHKEYVYSSVFAGYLNDFISARRKSGYLYDNGAYWLYRFDRFCADAQVSDPCITKALYEKWAVKSDMETKTTQRNRLQPVRCFSEYLNTLGIRSYMPLKMPKPEKNVPYLMTDKDISEFFEQVDLYDAGEHVPAFHRMALEYKVLFRLIYCCGLRNNEACSLKVEDIDLESGVMTIRQSKGNKDRVVYLSEDMRLLCLDYRNWMHSQYGDDSEWFFPGKSLDIHIPKTSVDRKFNEFWNTTHASSVCDKKPTVHCLRHAFVIRRVNLWMEKDLQLQVMMPYLSSYLGHKGPIETYYYYHQVEDVFKTVRRKDSMSARVIPEVQHEE